MRHAIRSIQPALVFSAAWLSFFTASAQTVINVPSAPAPSSIGAGTTLNVLPGGSLYSWFDAQSGSTVNLLGGKIPSMFLRGGATMQMNSGEAGAIVAYDGAAITVNGGFVSTSLEGNLNAQITGGRFERLWANSGSNVLISGGAFKQLIMAQDAEVELLGVDFFIDGVPVSGLNSVGDFTTVDVPGDSTLTGVLANGTAFSFYNPLNYDAESFKISRSAAPPVLPPGDVVVNAPSNLEFVGAGQTLKFQTGGQLPKHFRAAPGSRVEVGGGYVADGFHAVGADVVIDGGTIGYDFYAFKDTNVWLKAGAVRDSTFLEGSVLNVEGGEFIATMRRGSTMNMTGGTLYRAYARDAVVNIHGGVINDYSADIGSETNVTGGQFEQFTIHTGVANVSGGTFNDDFFNIRIDAELALNASEFRLNGTLLANLDNVGNSRTVTLGPQDVLSGVFDDGTPFIFSGFEGRIEEPVKLVRSVGYVPGPAVINVPTAAAPKGLHQGQSLTLRDGGTLPKNFSAIHGSSVKIEGGSVDSNFEVLGATVDATGGTLHTIDAFTGGVVNLGGTVAWSGLNLYAGSVANITGGRYGGGNFFNAHSGSELNISGGELRGVWHAENAEVNISGGTVDVYRQENVATTNSVVNLSGGYVQDLNLYDGAKLNATGGGIRTLIASTRTEMRIADTSIDRMEVNYGADAEITSGVVGEIDVQGGTLRIRGGGIGDSHEWLYGGVVEIYGNEFEVNGAALPGLGNVGDSIVFNYTPGTTFTGSLQDGAPFVMSPTDSQGTFYTVGATVRLIRTAAPTLPGVVDVTSEAAPYGAAAGQQVNVEAGGKLRKHFTAGRGSVVEVRGGEVGENFEADRSQVKITGGSVGGFMDVFKDATVDLRGGSIGSDWEVHAGGEVKVSGGALGSNGRLRGGKLNVSGGTVANNVYALDQSVVNVSGGDVGNDLKVQGGSAVNVSGGRIGRDLQVATSSTAHVSGGRITELELQATAVGEIVGGVVDQLSVSSGATANISGGAFGDGFTSSAGAQVTLHGASFEINGVPVSGLAQSGDQRTLTVASNELFTGVLADGTPFAFDSREFDQPRTVALAWAQPVAAAPVVEVTSSAAPLGIRAGQQLNLRAGGQLTDNFNVGRGAELNVHSGVVGKNLEAVAATVNVYGGQIGADLDAFAGAIVNLKGGRIEANFDLYAGATLNVEGGYATSVDALMGSNVQIHGGKVRALSLQSSSQVDWAGGVVDAFVFQGSAANSVNVFGVDFKLNGNPIAGLGSVGASVAFNPSPSDVLTGVLADGTPMVFRDLSGFIPTGAIRLNRSAAPGLKAPDFQKVVDANAPFAIGAGQMLQLDGAGILGEGFIAGTGSTLRIDQGVVNAGLKAFSSNVLIKGGVVKSNLQFFENVNADIFGGTFEGTTPLIMGGSDVTLYGARFYLNDSLILGPGMRNSTLVLNQRSGQFLKAIFADGSELQWRLMPFTSDGRGGPVSGISAAATLRLQVIPEPAAIQIAAASLALSACYARRRSSR